MAFPYGTVLRTAEERFFEKVEVQRNGCWLWSAGTAGEGYGYFYAGRSRAGEHGRVYAHRWAYEHLVGPIPDGLVVDHFCFTRRCVNPDHLSLVPQLVNVRHGRGNGKQTHCPHGHPYSGANLYVPPKGGRVCRMCRSESLRKHKTKNIGKKESK